ncbi:MAG TPA: hypothetical protein VM115_05560 [Vicinamibacterales bacterium]|nr:hypothetical protein [Vicinamibacterales bacterium]
MTRFLSTALVVALVAAPIFAQAPAGWQVRADRSTSATDPDGAGDIKFTAIPGGFRANNPTAAIYWNPANTAKGNYTLRGTFKLLEPSGHNNYYGLIIGGRALEGSDQNYLYFVVAQDGSFLIRKRAGDRMPDPNAPARGRGGRGPQAITEDVARGPHEAVRKPGTDGTSTNTLELRVAGETLSFVVNGTVVHTMPKGTVVTDGIYGIRVNHLLNVEITDFGLA